MWFGHHFQDQKVKGQLAEARAYCGGLPHSLLNLTPVQSEYTMQLNYTVEQYTYNQSNDRKAKNSADIRPNEKIQK